MKRALARRTDYPDVSPGSACRIAISDLGGPGVYDNANLEILSAAALPGGIVCETVDPRVARDREPHFSPSSLGGSCHSWPLLNKKYKRGAVIALLQLRNLARDLRRPGWWARGFRKAPYRYHQR